MHALLDQPSAGRFIHIASAESGEGSLSYLGLVLSLALSSRLRDRVLGGEHARKGQHSHLYSYGKRPESG